MINGISPLTPVNVKGDGLSETVNVEKKLGLDKVNENEKLYLDGLYASLKKLFKSSPSVKANEIIQHVTKFVAADGTSPYSSIRTHTVTIAEIMQMFKADGEEGQDFYKTLNQSVGYSVVSNGMLDKFIGDMLRRPEEEEPEGW
jgi:hypothetical protein